jgi:hypothetical protein
VHNLLASDSWFIGEEWRVAHKHFEQNAADWPPVHCFIIPILPKYFRSNIVRSTYCRKGQLPISLSLS